MIAGVADTHTALWYLLRNPLLSETARQFIDSAAASGNDIVLSPISLAEILYLTEKNRLPVSAYTELKRPSRTASMSSGSLSSIFPSSKPCARFQGMKCRTCLTASSPQRLSALGFPSLAGMAKFVLRANHLVVQPLS